MTQSPSTPPDADGEQAEPQEPPLTESYLAVQLHDRSQRCWAVVAEPGGAIAEDDTGTLITQLTAHEAQRMAAAMNGVLRDATASAITAALTLILARANAAPPERRAVA